MNQSLLVESRKIFCFDSLDDKEFRNLVSKARNLLDKNEYSEVFECWNYILRNECDNEDKVIRFVELILAFIGFPIKIPHPYDPFDFIGYIYSKVDLEKRWSECGDLFDSFANDILENSNNLDLRVDPYYQFWRDPKIIEIAQKYGKKI